jgi:hypothetical protein
MEFVAGGGIKSSEPQVLLEEHHPLSARMMFLAHMVDGCTFFHHPPPSLGAAERRAMVTAW